MYLQKLFNWRWWIIILKYDTITVDYIKSSKAKQNTRNHPEVSWTPVFSFEKTEKKHGKEFLGSNEVKESKHKSW